MGRELNRRALFSPAAREVDSRVVVRPPWSEETTIQNSCDGCSDCVSACDENLITLDLDGYPALNLATRGCTLCGSCLAACAVKAIGASNSRAPQDAFHHVVDITHACLSLKGVSCRLCEDACDEQAIRFKLMTEGRALPYVRANDCTGCGQCVGTCPAQALKLVPAPDPMPRPANKPIQEIHI